MPSSYAKGINALFEEKGKIIEKRLIVYILRTNSKYNSRTFPSTTLAKVCQPGVHKAFQQRHKVVKMILNQWASKGLCELLTKSSSSSRANKEVYTFTEQAIKEFKERYISDNIKSIENDEELDDEKVMKTREEKIDEVKDILDNLLLPDI